MTKVNILPYAHITLSSHDEGDLRKLIIEEIEYSKKIQSSEELIRHATKSIIHFLNTRPLELISRVEVYTGSDNQKPEARREG